MRLLVLLLLAAGSASAQPTVTSVVSLDWEGGAQVDRRPRTAIGDGDGLVFAGVDSGRLVVMRAGGTGPTWTRTHALPPALVVPERITLVAQDGGYAVGLVAQDGGFALGLRLHADGTEASRTELRAEWPDGFPHPEITGWAEGAEALHGLPGGDWLSLQSGSVFVVGPQGQLVGVDGLAFGRARADGTSVWWRPVLVNAALSPGNAGASLLVTSDSAFVALHLSESQGDAHAEMDVVAAIDLATGAGRPQPVAGPIQARTVWTEALRRLPSGRRVWVGRTTRTTSDSTYAVERFLEPAGKARRTWEAAVGDHLLGVCTWGDSAVLVTKTFRVGEGPEYDLARERRQSVPGEHVVSLLGVDVESGEEWTAPVGAIPVRRGHTDLVFRLVGCGPRGDDLWLAYHVAPYDDGSSGARDPDSWEMMFTVPPSAGTSGPPPSVLGTTLITLSR